MSKHNKVNPGTYTQAGRLSPDDTAREMKKQREVASPSQQDGKAQLNKQPPSRVTEKDNTENEDEEESEQKEER